MGWILFPVDIFNPSDLMLSVGDLSESLSNVLIRFL